MRDDPFDLCPNLRTRQTRGVIVDGVVLPWQSGQDPSASYWCLVTSSPVGPDESFAHPHFCGAERACCRAGGG